MEEMVKKGGGKGGGKWGKEVEEMKLEEGVPAVPEAYRGKYSFRNI